MSPIFADVGPDGAVWVIDFYSFIIQHNPTPSVRSAGIEATTGQGGAYMTENNLRDQVHGRIYRVVWKDGPKSSIKSLAGAKPAELVAGARQRQPVLEPDRPAPDRGQQDDGRRPGAEKARGFRHWRQQARSMPSGRSKESARSTRTRIRRHCWTRIPPFAATPFAPCPRTTPDASCSSAVAVIQDPDLLTREVAFVKLAEFPTIPEIQTVVAQLPRIPANTNDPFLNDALTLLGRIHKVSGVGENEVKVAAGDPKRGEDLFFNSPTAACATCHTVGGKGGAIGPILDGIAVRSDKDYILESLVEPNAKLAKGFESLGISPMPPLGVLLKEQELADILAFLQTLTTPPKDGVTVPVQKPAPTK